MAGGPIVCSPPVNSTLQQSHRVTPIIRKQRMKSTGESGGEWDFGDAAAMATGQENTTLDVNGGGDPGTEAWPRMPGFNT